MTIKSESEFEQIILRDFPDLFPKDENGKPHCPQGIFIPASLQAPVYECLNSINEYAQAKSRQKKRIPRIFPITQLFMSLYKIGKSLASFVSRKNKNVASASKVRSWIFYKIFRVSYFFLHYSKKLDKTPYAFPQISRINKRLRSFKVSFDSGHDDFIGGIVFHAEVSARSTNPIT